MDHVLFSPLFLDQFLDAATTMESQLRIQGISMAKFEEIKRQIELGQSNREIARALHIRRVSVAGIRRGELSREVFELLQSNGLTMPRIVEVSWGHKVKWGEVEEDLKSGHQIKRVWEEYGSEAIGYNSFYKYVKKRFSELLSKTVTLREFEAGKHTEVDFAGDKVEWIERRTGEIKSADIFVGVLCFSQLVFARAVENQKKANWIDCHERMYRFFGGSTAVTVSDNLKSAVTRSDLYDPDINPDYLALAKHYGTAVVPARSRKPKDKAIVENMVGILMRYFCFKSRRKTFFSIEEINSFLNQCVREINEKIHSRFKVSRLSRYNEFEKKVLSPLPSDKFEVFEFKMAKLHADCTVAVNGNYYSAPQQ